MTRLPLERNVAYDLVVEKIGVNNLLKHILAVEAGMRRLAKHLGEDADYWALVGLLHDLDYNETKNDEENIHADEPSGQSSGVEMKNHDRKDCQRAQAIDGGKVSSAICAPHLDHTLKLASC